MAQIVSSCVNGLGYLRCFLNSHDLEEQADEHEEIKEEDLSDQKPLEGNSKIQHPRGFQTPTRKLHGKPMGNPGWYRMILQERSLGKDEQTFCIRTTETSSKRLCSKNTAKNARTAWSAVYTSNIGVTIWIYMIHYDTILKICNHMFEQFFLYLHISILQFSQL